MVTALRGCCPPLPPPPFVVCAPPDRRLLWFVLGFPLTTQWRGVHFFAVHRGMHPWWHIRRSVWDGDLGATLYRHVHSLHHKSFNPGPWSSLSMHPVEHIFYFSCFALAFVVPYHPLHLLCNK